MSTNRVAPDRSGDEELAVSDGAPAPVAPSRSDYPAPSSARKVGVAFMSPSTERDDTGLFKKGGALEAADIARGLERVESAIPVSARNQKCQYYNDAPPASWPATT